jgi:LysR family transcriptional regulator, nitrogen assimilation regulatory protein
MESPRGRRLHRPAAWRGYRSGHLAAACNLADVALSLAPRGRCAIHLRQLRYFVKIVEAGSISRAAAVVYVAQPALSSQIAELEQELGVVLLQRSARGVKPTTAGEVLYREATALLRQFEKIPEIVRTTGKDAAGSVSIGMASTLAYFLSGPFMKACKDALPNVSLSFFNEDSASLRARIRQRTLDLAVVFEQKPVPGLVRLELFRQRTFLLHTDESKRSVAELSLANVAQIPLILPGPANNMRRVLDHLFAQAGLKPIVAAEIQDFASDLAAVRSGLGAALLPVGDLSGLPGAENLIATPVESSLDMTACVVSSDETPLNGAGEAVRSFVHSFITQYVRDKKPRGAELTEA